MRQASPAQSPPVPLAGCRVAGMPVCLARLPLPQLNSRPASPGGLQGGVWQVSDGFGGLICNSGRCRHP
jgi:hypothetical protein